jgi:hypothetical protein
VSFESLTPLLPAANPTIASHVLLLADSEADLGKVRYRVGCGCTLVERTEFLRTPQQCGVPKIAPPREITICRRNANFEDPIGSKNESLGLGVYPIGCEHHDDLVSARARETGKGGAAVERRTMAIKEW